MNRLLASLLFVFSAAPVLMGQCAIQPIKPIPPIGCKDVTPQCVSESNGQSHWNWVCVPSNADNNTSSDHAWKPRIPAASTPSGANQDTNRATPRDPYRGSLHPNRHLESRWQKWTVVSNMRRRSFAPSPQQSRVARLPYRRKLSIRFMPEDLKTCTALH